MDAAMAMKANATAGDAVASITGTVATGSLPSKVRVVWAFPNVSMRTSETVVLLGFLALCTGEDTGEIHQLSANEYDEIIMEDVFDGSVSGVSEGGRISPSPIKDLTPTLNYTPVAAASSSSESKTPEILDLKGSSNESTLKPATTTKDAPRTVTPTSDSATSTSKPRAKPPRPKLYLCWFAKNSCSNSELQALREAVSRTKAARPPPPSATNPFPPIVKIASNLDSSALLVSISDSSLCLQVQDIISLFLSPVLMLTQGGDTACLIKLGTEMDMTVHGRRKSLTRETLEDEDVDELLYEELWFENDETQREFTLMQAHDELAWWFASVGLGLMPIDRPKHLENDALKVPKSGTSSKRASRDGLNADTGASAAKDSSKATPVPEEGNNDEDKDAVYFQIVERSALIAAFPLWTSAGVGQKEKSKEWPVQLPISQNSLVYKLGAFGLGVASSIVGQTISNKVEDVARSAAWDVMERFTRVTKFAQSTGRQVVEHPFARPILPLIPSQIRTFILSSVEAETLVEEYDSAAHYLQHLASELQGKYLGKRQRKPSESIALDQVDKTRDFESLAIGRKSSRTGTLLTAEEWIGFYGVDGKLTISEDVAREKVFHMGIENDIRPEVWKFILHVYPWDSTEAERREVMNIKRIQYDNMKRQWKTILEEATEVAIEKAKATGTKADEEYEALAGDEREDGDVVSKIKERKYRVEKDVVRTDRTVPFFAGSTSDDAPQATTQNAFVVEPPRVFSPHLEMLKDALITYTIYNFELGYVQGMNDLLAPLLAITQNEVDAFWCFTEFMETAKFNFYRDQSGMRKQLQQLNLLIKLVDPPLHAHLESIDSSNLFCCFRWLLIIFKREFEFDDIMKLWECMWACPLTKHFHIFVALAILNKHRRSVIVECQAFDEMIKFTNDLSGKMDLEDILKRAEVLFDVFKEMITIAAWERLGVNIETGLSKNNTIPILEPTNSTASAATSSEKPASIAPPVSLSQPSVSPTPMSRQASNMSSKSKSKSKSRSRSRSKSASPTRKGAGSQVSVIDDQGIWDLLELLHK